MTLSVAACGGVQGGGGSSSESGDDFPTKSIEWVAPSSAGGSTDLISRAAAKAMEKPLGQSVVVQNREGANGAVGGKDVLPGPLAPLGRRLFGRPRRLPVSVPVVTPEFRLQFVHQEDVGRALQLCVVAAGPPGAYNIAGDGVLTAADVAREFGALPIPVPAAPAQLAARAVARLPFLPPAAEWVEAASRPVIMDTAKAKQQLGWRPRYTGWEALRDTLR